MLLRDIRHILRVVGTTYMHHDSLPRALDAALSNILFAIAKLLLYFSKDTKVKCAYVVT